MIDAMLQPAMHRVLAPPARGLSRIGITADQVTIGGFVVGLATVAALAIGAFGVALVLLAVNRLADGLDGAIARRTRPTDRGAFLDIALDFLFYALFPLGFALHDPANALPAALLIASFVGTGASFLAFSTVAAKQGLTAADFPSKGIYYLGGLTEGTETIVVFVGMCLWPHAFAPIAYVFAAACGITTATRLWMGWVSLGNRQTDATRTENS